MAHGYDTMMNPSIEDLLEKTGSKFRLVSLSAMRSRDHELPRAAQPGRRRRRSAAGDLHRRQAALDRLRRDLR